MENATIGSAEGLKDSLAVVTGVSGFLGRALASRLIATGASVTGLDANANVGGQTQAVDYHQADILDYESLAAQFNSLAQRWAGSIIVYHLAGLGHAGTCQDNPLLAFEINCRGTVHVLEAMRCAGLSRIVVPSTALVYGTPQRLPVTEDDLPSPTSLYAASKLAAEAAVQGYAASYRFAATVARLGNVYGQTTPTDSIVSILMRQALHGGPLSVRTLRPVRDFIHRDDVVEALLRLGVATREPGYRVVNVASGVSRSIGDVAGAVRRAAKTPLSLEETEAASGERDAALVLSIDRLKQITAWQPRQSLDEGIARTLAALSLPPDK